MTTAASRASRLMTSAPSGDLRFTHTDFLLRDWRYHQSDVPSCSLRHLRKESPPLGVSILMSSAPNSAIMRAAKGAAISVPISITLMPLSGPLMPLVSVYMIR